MASGVNMGEFWALVLGCVMFLGASPLVAESCDTVEGIESICGLTAPEDIVRAPNGRDLIFSQYSAEGRLSLLDTHNQSVHTLFPGSDSTIGAEELWGDRACSEPPARFWPHGIDISQQADGRWKLLVVNHGERESVEFFELVEGEQGRPGLIWRGCVEGPKQSHFNDVAALPGDGFLVSQMYEDSLPVWNLIKAIFGVDTGFLYRWEADTGFEVIEGTQGKMPNGITVSPDGKSFFLNVYFDDEVRKYDLESGKRVGTVSVDKPDNASWSLKGQLLVASHTSSMLKIVTSTGGGGGEPSMLPFSIVEIDPQTLDTRVVLDHEGPPMGAGTVAVEQNGYLYIGSYTGDRMIKYPISRGL
ncbi:MAG: hypothetical protein HOC23_08195 [Halieaceae bacterium]|jgi:hypothetical protein|nr:hypothetical protein [Halieaceae bacterium]